MIDIDHFSQDLYNELRQTDDELLGRATTAQSWFEDRNIPAQSNQWALDTPWKRAIISTLYGDLLENQDDSLKVVEVGGGLSFTTLALAESVEYTLIERGDHEGAEAYKKFEREMGESFTLVLDDWSDAGLQRDADIVIANDIFPNVDNRLYEFAGRVIPHTTELRMTLTYYEDTVFDVERIQSGEKLTVKPWGTREISHWFEHLQQQWPEVAGEYDQDKIRYQDLSGELFNNNRNILLFRMDTDESVIMSESNE